MSTVVTYSEALATMRDAYPLTDADGKIRPCWLSTEDWQQSVCRAARAMADEAFQEDQSDRLQATLRAEFIAAGGSEQMWPELKLPILAEQLASVRFTDNAFDHESPRYAVLYRELLDVAVGYLRNGQSEALMERWWPQPFVGRKLP